MQSSGSVTRPPIRVAYETAAALQSGENFRRVDSGVCRPVLFEHIRREFPPGAFEFVALESLPADTQAVLVPVGVRGGVPWWKLEENLVDAASLLKTRPGTSLVLDYSWEGVAGSQAYDLIELALDRVGVDPNRVVLVNSNPCADLDYREHRLRQGLDPDTGLRVLGYPFFFLFSAAAFRDQRPQAGILADEEGTAARARRGCSKRFLSLNRRPRGHRLALGLYLYAHGLHQQASVSMPSLEYSSDWTPETDLAGLLSVQGCEYIELAAHRTEFFASLPWNLDFPIDNSGHTDALTFRSAGAQAYHDSFFSVVSETAMSDHRRFRFITEKTCKALVNMHPFLMLGDTGALAELRRYGFRTFPEWFDETYDEIGHCPTRLCRVLGEISRLCHSDAGFLKDLCRRSLPDLVHNRGLMLEYDRVHHGEITALLRNVALRETGTEAVIAGTGVRLAGYPWNLQLPRKAAGCVLVRHADGDYRIVVHGSDRVVNCNYSAALVFELCDGSRDVPAIIEQLRGGLTDAPADIDDQVHQALDQLHRQGVLRLE